MVDEQNPSPVGMGANILKHWKEPDIYQYQLVPRCAYASIAHVMPIRHWQRDLQSHILHELQMPFPCSALSVYHCPLCNYVGSSAIYFNTPMQLTPGLVTCHSLESRARKTHLKESRVHVQISR